jgi:hypothetical protein
MAVRLDNLDEVLKQFAKMEKAVEFEFIREARKGFRAIVRKLKPMAKKESPKKSGDLIKSIKIQSRSKRGRSTVRLLWAVPYAGPVNFKKGQSAERYATDLWDQKKASLDKEGSKVVREVMKQVLEKNGIKVI